MWVGVFQKINAPPSGEYTATVSGRTAMIKTMALRAGIYHHLKVSPDKQTAGRFYVARYHFPQPILEHCGQRRQTLLSKKEVRDLDQKIGDTILFKRINTVTSLMNTTSIILTDIEKESYAAKYVQVPTVSPEYLTSLATSFNTA